MGLFSGIKNTFKQSEAAVVVQSLLEHQASLGLYDGDPVRHATQIIDSVWRAKPDILNGNFGHRPHKISFAAFALAMTVKRMSMNDDTGMRWHFASAACFLKSRPTAASTHCMG